MSKSRQKKKQRRRTRGAAGAATPPPPGLASTGESAGGSSRSRPNGGRRRESPPDRRPSRLEVRDGVPRPDAIWAPFPLTEIGMAAGLVLFLLGFAGSPVLLLTGVGVLVVVVSELCLREHFTGFRSHSLLLALLPVTTLHLALVVVAGVNWRGPLALAVDVAIAGVLAWWLQRRFGLAQGRARLRAG